MSSSCYENEETEETIRWESSWRGKHRDEEETEGEEGRGKEGNGEHETGKGMWGKDDR